MFPNICLIYVLLKILSSSSDTVTVFNKLEVNWDFQLALAHLHLASTCEGFFLS